MRSVGLPSPPQERLPESSRFSPLATPIATTVALPDLGSGPVSVTTTRTWSFNAHDHSIRDVVLTPTYTGTPPRGGQTRGTLQVRLVQRASQDPETFVGVTTPVVINTMFLEPVKLGAASKRLVFGQPVLVEVTRSAPGGPLPLVWQGLTILNVTTTLN